MLKVSNFKSRRYGFTKAPFLLLLFVVAVAITTAVQAEIGVWKTTDEFLEEAFPETEQQPQILWITPELRSDMKTVLNRDFPGIRVRYWGDGARNAWILEQIGKERLITAGFATEQGKLVMASVLEYRESRGGEVRYNSFLEQFLKVGLNEEQKLDAHIDGITGATYSVRSMKQMAAAALTLDRYANGIESAATSTD